MPDVELKRIQPTKLNPRSKFSKSGLDDLLPLPRTCSAWERGRPGRWAAVICAGRGGRDARAPRPRLFPEDVGCFCTRVCARPPAGRSGA
jgi:hypothetical protein